MASDTAALTPPALNFIEKVSLHFETVYGLPRIGCRILALLLISAGPRSSLELERV